MTTTNKISMTTDTFIDLLPFALDSATTTRYLANLNDFRTKNIDGKETYHLWQHIEALKLAISWIYDGLNDVYMTKRVFLHDMNFSVCEFIQEQLTRRLTHFQEEFWAGEDHFKSWQLQLAFARCVEDYVIEEIENHEIS